MPFQRYSLLAQKKPETPVAIRDIGDLERPQFHPIDKVGIPRPKAVMTPREPGQNPPNRYRRLMGQNTRAFI